MATAPVVSVRVVTARRWRTGCVSPTTILPESASAANRVFLDGVKKAVASKWRPVETMRVHGYDPKAASARIIVLDVVLDGSGNVEDIVLERSSGLDYLDQEAIATFHKAQPFVNPPPHLEEAKCIQFAFFFKVEVKPNKVKDDSKPVSPQVPPKASS